MDEETMAKFRELSLPEQDEVIRAMIGWLIVYAAKQAVVVERVEKIERRLLTDGGGDEPHRTGRSIDWRGVCDRRFGVIK